MAKVCKCCKTEFIPFPTVKNQLYCRKSSCQQARKNHWQKMKLASDKDYRDNQAACRKRWREKHPDYWKEYRAKHPGYMEKNRLLQRERNQRRLRKRDRAEAPVIANMDESTPRKTIPFGRYRLVPVCNQVIAKMDEWIVEIGVISGPSAPASASP